VNLRSLFLLLVLAAIGVFAALNWSVIMMPTELNLVLATVQAPLGLVMLGLMVFLLAIFLVYLVYLQTTVLLDSRTHAKELQANRRLADQAEASRFTELRSFLETELKSIAVNQQAAQLATSERVAQLEQALMLALEQNSNSLAASIGEVDDKLRAVERP
jgi:uncharacterized integral membrane protein